MKCVIFSGGEERILVCHGGENYYRIKPSSAFSQQISLCQRAVMLFPTEPWREESSLDQQLRRSDWIVAGAFQLKYSILSPHVLVVGLRIGGRS